MNKKFSGLVLVAVLVLAALPLIASCAPSEEPPPVAPPAPIEVKPDEVWLRCSVAMTGPYAASLLPAAEAMKDGVEIRNTEHGGIDGVPWKVEVLDDGGEVAKAIANYEKLKAKEPKSIMMILISTSGCAEALRERFNEDGIIAMLPSGSTKALYPAGNSFCIVIPHPDGFGFFVDWLVETQTEPIKLGFCNWDSSFGRAVLSDECLNYAKGKGIEIVATELFPIMQMDVTTHLTKIKDAGANWIFTNTLGFGTVVVLKSAEALDMLGQDDIRFAGGHFAMDYDVRRVAGPLGEGFVGPHSCVTWDEVENPYVAERRAAFEAKGLPEEQRAQPYLVFKGWMDFNANIYEKAIAEVGWENLDAEALRSQLVQTKDLELPWTIFNYSADKPETNWARMVEFKDGKVLPITDWRKAPDLRAAEYK